MVTPLERILILINLYTQKPYLQNVNTKCCPMPKNKVALSQKPDTFVSNLNFSGGIQTVEEGAPRGLSWLLRLVEEPSAKVAGTAKTEQAPQATSTQFPMIDIFYRY